MGTVLITGVGRRRSIGATLAVGLAEDGWDVALSHWAPYDERIGLERGDHDPEDVVARCRALGRRVDLLPADLVRFLMSEAGGWITGQLLHSNGGFRTSG